MAHLRKRKKVTAGSSSRDPTPFDNSRFSSSIHEEWMENFVEKRGSSWVVEKRLQVTNPEINKFIIERKWENLCNLKVVGRKRLVLEFLANAKKFGRTELDFTTFVRTKEIDYRGVVINKMLGIPCDYEISGDYFDYLVKDIETIADEMLHKMCKEGAKWHLGKNNKPKHLWKEDLNPVAMVWCTFIQNTILPTKNSSEVQINRAVLIFSIMKGLRVNVGRIIAEDIFHGAQKDKGSIGHPIIITMLCHHNQILFAKDINLPKSNAIDDEKMAEYVKKFKEPPRCLQVTARTKTPIGRKKSTSSEMDMKQMMEKVLANQEEQSRQIDELGKQMKYIVKLLQDQSKLGKEVEEEEESENEEDNENDEDEDEEVESGTEEAETDDN